MELIFNFNLEFLNNRWANPAQTRAQSAPSLPPRERATAKRCDNKKEVAAPFFFLKFGYSRKVKGGWQKIGARALLARLVARLAVVDRARAEGVDFAPTSLHAKSRSFEGKEAPGALGPVAAEVAAARGASARSENVDPRAPGRSSAPRRGPIESPFVLAKWGGRRGGRRCVARVAHAPRDVHGVLGWHLRERDHVVEDLV